MTASKMRAAMIEDVMSHADAVLEGTQIFHSRAARRRWRASVRKVVASRVDDLVVATGGERSLLELGRRQLRDQVERGIRASA